MTVEEAKKELKDYIHDKKWLEERIEDIRERRDLLDKITITFSDMPKGSKIIQDKQAEELSKVLDLTDELEQHFKILKEKQINVESKIDKLPQAFKNIL